MIKNNIKKLIISSVVILLPMLVGVLLWDKLPEELPLHWNVSGEVDDYGSREFVVFGMPFIMLAVHFLAVFVTALDPKNKNQNKKPIALTLWLVPFLSVFLSLLTYGFAIGLEFKVEMITFVILGVFMTVLGNYMPKVKQNYTLGIKVVWALDNEENWNATHRLAGKLWTVGGLLLVLCAFLPSPYNFCAMIVITLAMTVIPVVYSYLYYKKHTENKEK